MLHWAGSAEKEQEDVLGPGLQQQAGPVFHLAVSAPVRCLLFCVCVGSCMHACVRACVRLSMFVRPCICVVVRVCVRVFVEPLEANIRTEWLLLSVYSRGLYQHMQLNLRKDARTHCSNNI